MKGLSVLSTTRFPEAVWADEPGGSLADSLVSESFAECAPKRLQIVLSAPVYSVENMCTPRFSIRLLIEEFWENSDLMVLAQSALHTVDGQAVADVCGAVDLFDAI